MEKYSCPPCEVLAIQACFALRKRSWPTKPIETLDVLHRGKAKQLEGSIQDLEKRSEGATGRGVDQSLSLTSSGGQGPLHWLELFGHSSGSFACGCGEMMPS